VQGEVENSQKNQCAQGNLSEKVKNAKVAGAPPKKEDYPASQKKKQFLSGNK